MNIAYELDNSIQILNKVDEYIDTLVEELSNYDKRTKDSNELFYDIH